MPVIVNEQKPRTLAARIVEAMKMVGRIEKAGENKAQHYSYQKAADIFAAAQNAFFTHGVCLIPSEIEIEWPEPHIAGTNTTMFVCRARMGYTFRDVESNEELTVFHSGEGFDTSDKALNKAKTAALKYCLKQMLLIGEEGDDSEEDSPEPRQAAACPNCGNVGSIIKGKQEYGGGWLCFGKKGGCGAKFQTDPAEVQKDNKPKAQKRPEEASKPSEATNPAPESKGGSDGSVGATAGTPESDVELQVQDMVTLLDQTKFPCGQEVWSLDAAIGRIKTMYKVNDLKDIKPDDRGAMLKNLLKRQKMIEQGQIKI